MKLYVSEICYEVKDSRPQQAQWAAKELVPPLAAGYQPVPAGASAPWAPPLATAEVLTFLACLSAIPL